MKVLEDEILNLVFEYGEHLYDQGYDDAGGDFSAKHEEVLKSLSDQIREKVHDLILQVDHSSLVVESAREHIEKLTQAEVQAEPDFYGFRNDDECRVDMCFSPSARRGDGVYATAYYTAPQAQLADALDADGEAFRTAAKLGLTLRFYGGCAQSSKPRTPSAYAEVAGLDPAASMREAVQKVKTTIGAAMAAAQETKS